MIIFFYHSTVACSMCVDIVHTPAHLVGGTVGGKSTDEAVVGRGAFKLTRHRCSRVDARDSARTGSESECGA